MPFPTAVWIARCSGMRRGISITRCRMVHSVAVGGTKRDCEDRLRVPNAVIRRARSRDRHDQSVSIGNADETPSSCRRGRDLRTQSPRLPDWREAEPLLRSSSELLAEDPDELIDLVDLLHESPPLGFDFSFLERSPNRSSQRHVGGITVTMSSSSFRFSQNSRASIAPAPRSSHDAMPVDEADRERTLCRTAGGFAIEPQVPTFADAIFGAVGCAALPPLARRSWPGRPSVDGDEPSFPSMARCLQSH